MGAHRSLLSVRAELVHGMVLQQPAKAPPGPCSGILGVAMASQQQSLVAGDLLEGRYRIGELLGEGGYGRVYRAVQLPLEREVAIKIVNARDSELVARFAREASIIRSLEHPNTVRVLDIGTTPAGDPFLVLELLRGHDLDGLLEERGRLPPEEALGIAAQVLKSLVEAHAKGIVHRDVKPGNVFITSHAGEPLFVKLLDFGIAKQLKSGEKLTAVGEALGTPSYMPPEQALGLPIDARTDLYALGLMLAEMVTGKLVFAKGGPLTILDEQMADAPVPLAREVLDSVVGPIVVRAVKKDPVERYQSAEEMLRDVEALRKSLIRVPPSAMVSTAPQGTSADVIAARPTVAAATLDGSRSASQPTSADMPFAPSPTFAAPQPILAPSPTFAAPQPILAPTVAPPVPRAPAPPSSSVPRALVIGMAIVVALLAAVLVLVLVRERPKTRPTVDEEESEPEPPKRTRRPPPSSTAPVVTGPQARNVGELKRAFTDAGYSLSSSQDGPEDVSLYTFAVLKGGCGGSVVRIVAQNPEMAAGVSKTIRDSPRCRVAVDGLVVVYVCFGDPQGSCADAASKLLVK